MRAAAGLLCSLLAAGCAATPRAESKRGSSGVDYLASARTVGPGTSFRPGPTDVLVAQAARADGMSCKVPSPATSVAHVEVFAANHVVVIPAGIGIAPPLVAHGAYAYGGRCVYPLRTLEPTGVLLIEPGPTRSLGQFFDLWGQPLNQRDVAGFHAPHGHTVSVFVDGTLWRGNPRSVSISAQAQITIEVGPFVRPHVRYSFPPIQAIGRGSQPTGSLSASS